jgi:hypothetical protein
VMDPLNSAAFNVLEEHITIHKTAVVGNVELVAKYARINSTVFFVNPARFAIKQSSLE